MFHSTIKRTKRRTLALQIDHEGNLIIRAPNRMPMSLIEEFIAQKIDWIKKHQKRIQEKNSLQPQKTYNKNEFLTAKKELQDYLLLRVRMLWENTKLPPYTSLKVTHSNKRWGSCSGKNGLCFSYRLHQYIDEDPKIIDAIIYHELAHLKEKNHGKKFWDIVFFLEPNYRDIMKRL